MNEADKVIKKLNKKVVDSKEEISKKEESLKKEISRLSHNFASKLPFSNNERQRSDIIAALSLLTQSLILSEDSSLRSEVRKLMSLARRLAK